MLPQLLREVSGDSHSQAGTSFEWHPTDGDREAQDVPQTVGGGLGLKSKLLDSELQVLSQARVP